MATSTKITCITSVIAGTLSLAWPCISTLLTEPASFVGISVPSWLGQADEIIYIMGSLPGLIEPFPPTRNIDGSQRITSGTATTVTGTSIIIGQEETFCHTGTTTSSNILVIL